MRNQKLVKAIFLSVITVAAGHSAAASSGRSDSVPARPNQESIAEKNADKGSDCCSRQDGNRDHMMSHDMMGDSDMMSRCKEMHEQMQGRS